MTDDDARISGRGPHRRVELTRRLAHPIDTVWNALIDPAAIACWFTDAEIEAKEGGRLLLKFPGATVDATITTCQPPFVLAYRWRQDGEDDSFVTFDLVADGADATLLTVVQTALETRIAGEVAGGWTVMLGRLVGYLASGEKVPFDRDRDRELCAAYQREIDATEAAG